MKFYKIFDERPQKFGKNEDVPGHTVEVKLL